MKVWIVSVGEPLPTDGENTRLRRMGNLAYCLSQNGHIVEWFSVSFDHYKKIQRYKESADIAVNNSIIIHLQYTSGYKKNISLSRIIHHIAAGRNIYKKMNTLEKPDIIIASMEPLEVSSIATQYGIANNVPVVVDVRDLWPEIYYEVLPKKLHLLIMPYVQLCRQRLRRTMSRAYSIIALSEEFLMYGLKFARRDRNLLDKVYPIAYPNYDYNMYKQQFKKHWEKHNLDTNDFIIVFFGNFGKQFSFESIIEASKLLKFNPKIKFVLCGTGVQLENVRRKTPDNVIFPGWIDKEQIASLAANASLAIAPYINSMNYTQNTPNKFGEYLSASLPIIVSVTGSMENLLSEYQCGFKYSNGENLADIINNYFYDRDKLAKHSRNARQLYAQRYDGDVTYKKMVEYLIEVKEAYIKYAEKDNDSI